MELADAVAGRTLREAGSTMCLIWMKVCAEEWSESRLMALDDEDAWIGGPRPRVRERETRDHGRRACALSGDKDCHTGAGVWEIAC